MDTLKTMNEYKGGFYVEPVPNLSAGVNFTAADETPTTIAEKIRKFGFKHMHDKGYIKVTPDEKTGAVVSEPVPTLSAVTFEPTSDVAAKMKKYGADQMVKKGYIFSIQ